MKKEQARRCVELTQTALERYWRLDSEYVVGLCDHDVVLIAPEPERFLRGIDNVAADLRRWVRSPSHMTQMQFEVAQNCGNACSVVGRYLVTADAGAEGLVQTQQRCQFNWEREDGELRIKSIHVSKPSRDLPAAEGEGLAGKATQRCIEARMGAQTDRRRLVFPEAGGPIRFVALDEIVWVAARRKHTLVHTVSGDYEASVGLSVIARSLGDDFVSVHRSYIVNPGYVSAIGSREVVMTDDTRVPVPEKRHAEVVRRFTEVTS